MLNPNKGAEYRMRLYDSFPRPIRDILKRMVFEMESIKMFLSIYGLDKTVKEMLEVERRENAHWSLKD